jgi:enoyl-CoA hydratase/carnithine racemase
MSTVTRDLIVEHEEGGLAVVTLNRPSKRNAINLAMWQELKAIFGELSGARDVRAVILTGSGGNFSAGGDISEFATLRATVEAGTFYERAEEEALLAVLHCGKPTVAEISGFAIGGACALMLACDFRVADAGASFFIPAGRLGIVYSRLESELLLRQVGLTNAKLILFSGERMTAAEAVRLGLVNEVVTGNVPAAARRFAKRFAASAPLSIAGNKFILNVLSRGEADDRSAEVDAFIHRSMESEDYKEGQRAFGEKRAPVFKGR